MRSILQSYFGAIGTVAFLPAELQKLETESHVRVMTVNLEDGRLVTIPRVNAEIIKEE